MQDKMVLTFLAKYCLVLINQWKVWQLKIKRPIFDIIEILTNTYSYFYYLSIYHLS